MTIEVTSCSNCPFERRDEIGYEYCGHPESNIEESEMPTYDDKYNDTEFIPLRCPLISHSTLIRKADNATIK